MRDVNLIFSEMAEYKRIQEETAAMIDTLTDEIKTIMTETNNYKIIANEHKAEWMDIKQNRVDTTKLKKEYPLIAEQLTSTSTYKRFIFS